ncbi:hypothetical protein SLA2020_008450 [Shorea laevis]
MDILKDDVVIIRPPDKDGGPRVITVNCPDKIGLGLDLCRILRIFGLSIVKGDISTDGKWCYIICWVVTKSSEKWGSSGWELLKKRLMEACPSCYSVSGISYYCSELQSPEPPDVFLLKLCCHDRIGLLHDVAGVLCKLELIIKKMKVSTTPNGRVIDLFFIPDTRKLLHTQYRFNIAIHEAIGEVLRDSMISCKIEMVGFQIPACSQASSFLPSVITKDIFPLEISNELPSVSPAGSVSVSMDNSFSPSHTVVQIVCQDHKGLLYDIMRTLKDYNIQTSYGRFSVLRGKCEIELFIIQADGKKIVDPNKQNALYSRLWVELLQPLRVALVSHGPYTELLVANPVESSGKGRPLVFHDITRALKMQMLDTCIFSAEIGRHTIGDREWEVHRVLLHEGDGFPIPRAEIAKGVWNMLMSQDY